MTLKAAASVTGLRLASAFWFSTIGSLLLFFEFRRPPLHRQKLLRPVRMPLDNRLRDASRRRGPAHPAHGAVMFGRFHFHPLNLGIVESSKLFLIFAVLIVPADSRNDVMPQIAEDPFGV